MQTILGANGVIARELARTLPTYTDRIRLVSRTPQPIHPTDELVRADLLDPDAVDRAVAGSRIAYLVAGLRYQTTVWAREWPLVMENVIRACTRHRTRLVFFDNVYAYGRVEGAMAEETPLRPSSAKGRVRARIATRLLDAMRAGMLEATIVRAADFYGPGAVQSFVHAAIFERLRQGKTPQWIGNPRAVHSFTYTPDAGQATAVLAQSEAAYGHTWHAPTSREPITGEEFVRFACEAAGRPYRIQVAPGWLLRIMGIVSPLLRENQEMMYQFEHDYRFDSRRTEAEFGFIPTPYREGIEMTMRSTEVSG